MGDEVDHGERYQLLGLTICQPWAWAIAAGHKRVENRTWPTNYRGRLAIHAGKSRRWLHGTAELIELGLAVPPGDGLMFGAIVAVADLADVVRFDGAGFLGRDPFASGPWCWLLENVRALGEPVACPGRQGLWRPSLGVLRAIRSVAGNGGTGVKGKRDLLPGGGANGL